MQTRHVLKALDIVEDHHASNKSIAWRISFELDSEELLLDYFGRAVEFWYLTLELYNLKFIISKQSIHNVTSDFIPFLEIVDNDSENTYLGNEDTHKDFRSWAFENLEALVLDLIGNKINQFLAEAIKIDPEFFTQLITRDSDRKYGLKIRAAPTMNLNSFSI